MLLVFFTKLDRKSSPGSTNILKNKEKVFTFHVRNISEKFTVLKYSTVQ